MDYTKKKIYKKWIPWTVLLVNLIIATTVDAIVDFSPKTFSFQVISLILLLIKASMEIAQEVSLNQFSTVSISVNYICCIVLSGVMIYTEYKLNHFMTAIIVLTALIPEIGTAIFCFLKSRH